MGKKCKICGEEVKKRDNLCNTCKWIEKAKDKYDKAIWSKEEVEIILSKIIKCEIILLNDLIPHINGKSLKDICILLNKQLNFRGGNYSVKAKVKCKTCGEYTLKTPYDMVRSDEHFCSNGCNIASQKIEIKYNCANCNKEKIATPSQLKNVVNNKFCSHKCADEFNGNAKDTKVTLICKQCEEPYKVSKYREYISKFCSNACKNIWQGENIKGDNHPLYSQESVICEMCGKPTMKKLSEILSNKHHFCGKKCSNKWFKEVYSQSDEVRAFHREKAIKQISEGRFSETMTKPHLKINNLLEDMGIDFRNEELYYKQSIDIYLPKYDIPIEVMGTYWHLDPRFYSNIKSVQQADSPRKDKIKHSYIKNNYDIEILYLWENDIDNNIDICEQMIWDYIKNKKLKEYHSFNYDCDNKLIPFMELPANEIRELTDISVKKERNKRQEDKWDVYTCPQCNHDFEGLKSHMDKYVTNCCSYECRYEYQKKRSNVICATCGEPFIKKDSDIKRNKSGKFYCTRVCYLEKGGTK